MMFAVGAALAVSLTRNLRPKRRSPGWSIVLHAGLLMVLIGGGITAFTGERGHLVLNHGGEAATTWLVEDGSATRPLPAPLALDSFVISRHAAVAAPSGFTSHISVGNDGATKATVSVNNPLRIGSHRFYQASYGEDGSTVLGVDHDPYRGREVTYGGYALVAIGFTLCLARRFRGRSRGLVLLLAIVAGLFPVSASAAPRGVSLADAARLDTLQVMYRGRVAPFSTVATELLRTLAGPEAPSTQKAMAITASIPLFPEDWVDTPILYVESEELRQALGMESDLIAPADLYDAETGEYRLAALYHGTEKGLDKEIILVDSRLEAFKTAAENRLWEPLGAGADKLPEWRTAVERFYSGVPMRRIAFMALLSAGLLALVISVCFQRESFLQHAVAALLCAVVAWQATETALRWIIGGIAPLTSGSDALAAVSLMLALASLLLWTRRRLFIGALTALTGGFAALVAWLGEPSSTIVPVMPVLASGWLAIHVTLVMSAYAMLTVTFVIAAADIFRPSQLNRESIHGILLPALFLLTLGICTGAVWAGQSWGRYWAWDPKETWALITLLTYAAPLHFHLRGRRLDTYILLAFLTVIMTYWGVNYLPSLHAYQ